MLDVSADAAVEEHQVEAADLRLAGLLLEQPDVAAGMFFPQPAHHCRQITLDTLWNVPISTRPSPPEPVERGCHRGRLGEQVAPVGQDQAAERGDPHRLRPARPVEHCPADGLLQRRDLLADRRLAVAHPCSGPAERTLIGDGRHGSEMPQLRVRHDSQLTQRSIVYYD